LPNSVLANAAANFLVLLNIITIVIGAVVMVRENYCNTHPHLEHQLSSANGKLALE